MLKINLKTLAQKKLLMSSLLIAFVFLSIWLFLYLPNKHKLIRMKLELSRLEKDIQEIEAIIAQIRSSGSSIGTLRQRYQRLHSRFPQKEEESLKKLFDFAGRLRLEVIAIRPGPRRQFLDEENKPLFIEGRPCQALPISIQMKGAYPDLVEYLKTIQESLPAFVTTESLRMNKDQPGRGKLNILLDINLYLSS